MEITRLLIAWKQGSESALEELTPIIYSELHRIAAIHMANQSPDHLLQPSALVNEAYLRLLQGAPGDWESRKHFFAAAARLMRHILIDVVRAELTEKRGGRRKEIPMDRASDETGFDMAVHPEFLLDLDQALNRLDGLSHRQAQVVELRFFAGLNNSEIASSLNISEATVIRDWRLARAWLFDFLSGTRE